LLVKLEKTTVVKIRYLEITLVGHPAPGVVFLIRRWKAGGQFQHRQKPMGVSQRTSTNWYDGRGREEREKDVGTTTGDFKKGGKGLISGPPAKGNKSKKGGASVRKGFVKANVGKNGQRRGRGGQ